MIPHYLYIYIYPIGSCSSEPGSPAAQIHAQRFQISGLPDQGHNNMSPSLEKRKLLIKIFEPLERNDFNNLITRDAFQWIIYNILYCYAVLLETSKKGDLPKVI